MYSARIEKKVKGPAILMSPICESEVDRAVFNACVRKLFGDRNVETDEEFMQVAEWQEAHEETIVEILSEIDVQFEENAIETVKESDLRNIEQTVFENLE